jgi:hypothetical protein
MKWLLKGIIMILKSCSKCGQPKTLDEFNKDKLQKDGHRPDCKECRKKQQSEYRNRPSVYTTRAEYRKEHAENNRSYAKMSYKKNGRTRSIEGDRVRRNQWRHNNPLATNAHDAVQRAVQDGRLPAASNQICHKCHAQADEYHHYLGYQKDVWLNVIPLCRSCHKLIHLELR